MFKQQNDQYIELDLIESIQTIWKAKLKIFFFTFVVTTIVVAISFQIKPTYQATCSFIIKNNSNLSSPLASLIGSNTALNLPMFSSNPAISDIKEVIESNSIAEDVVKKLNLETFWLKNDSKTNPTLLNSITRLKSMLKLGKPKHSGNIIVLNVQSKDPALAKNIANTYQEVISTYYQELYAKDIKTKKLFIEKQLPLVEAKLLSIENRYKGFLNLVPSNINIAGSKSIEGIRIQRELEIQNNLYILLKKEHEKIKLERLNTIHNFVILDEAVRPQYPIKPKKKKMAILTLFLSGFLGIAFTLLKPRKSTRFI